MEFDKFTDKSTGQLVEISGKLGRDWAFIPADLEDSDLDPVIWPLLVQSHASLGTLNGIGQTLTEPKLLLRPLQNREAITSSRIEGTYVTPEQLILFEMNPTETSRPNERVADWIEVHNYGLALAKGIELLETMPICNRLVREMHKVLMQGVRGKDKTPGEFRRHQVQIGHNARFVPAPSAEVTGLMDRLERYINSDTKIDPLVKCFLVHYQFETIHPFLDGNGRIGRALLALMIFKLLGHKWPWLYMSAFYDKYKDEYIDGLYKVSSEGSWTKWIEYCLRGAIIQAKDSIMRCNEFNRLKKEYHSRITAPSPRTHALIESIFVDPFVQISKIASSMEVVYQTAKADIKILVDAGVLKELSQTRPKTFYSPDVFRAAYADMDAVPPTT